MLKQALLYSLSVVLLASCASLKTAFTGKQQSSQKTDQSVAKADPKFLDQIDVEMEKVKDEKKTVPAMASKNNIQSNTYNSFLYKEQPEPSSLQVKYSILLNTATEEVRNTKMFEFIDGWYGTPYRLGGNTKKGIDCSAFSQFLFAAVYGASIPRTAREQYKLTNRISRTDLKEGDLIFFNTRGGVSHVGVYLQNNKFVHASTSGGVMISDIFDGYWVKKFIGVGRMKDDMLTASSQ
jgi:cell wall-associated NlpC family hydrolase